MSWPRIVLIIYLLAFALVTLGVYLLGRQTRAGESFMDTADKLEEELHRARKELEEYNRDVRDGLTRNDPAERYALRLRIEVCQEALTNHYRLKQQATRG